MTCRELADFIADYLAGELAPDVRSAFDRHLERCPNCVRYLASYRDAVTLGARAFDDGELPPEVPEELIRAILSLRRPYGP